MHLWVSPCHTTTQSSSPHWSPPPRYLLMGSAQAIWMLHLGRFLTGIAGGMTAASIPVGWRVVLSPSAVSQCCLPVLSLSVVSQCVPQCCLSVLSLSAVSQRCLSVCPTVLSLSAVSVCVCRCTYQRSPTRL